MSAPEHMPESERAIWDEVCARYGEDCEVIEGPELEAFVGQVARLREAQKRIAAEGLITADPKGYPIPHPAIAIEKAAQAEIRAWGSKFAPKRTSNAGAGASPWGN